MFSSNIAVVFYNKKDICIFSKELVNRAFELFPKYGF